MSVATIEAEPNVEPVISDPKPGYLTTEFWQTILVHGLAALAVILDACKVNWTHMDAAQSAIPVAALVIATVAQAAYSYHRTQVKMQTTRSAVDLEVAKLRAQVSPTVAEVRAFEPVINNVVPAAQKVEEVARKVEDAVTGKEAASASAATPAPEPAPAPAPAAEGSSTTTEGDTEVVAGTGAA